jgi:peptidoglycan/LPS O-acetylase OafA/YrhL
MYILHMPILAWWRRLRPDHLHLVVDAAIYLSLVIAVSVLVLLLIEKPLIGAARRLKRQHPDADVAVRDMAKRNDRY